MKESKAFNSFLIVLITIVSACSPMEVPSLVQKKYIWKNVQIVGGGFMDGFVFHSLEKDLIYARTDMGGAYRRDMNSKIWVPLTDWVSYKDRNLMGIESIALDSKNQDLLYMACGTYTDDKTPNGENLIFQKLLILL